MAIKRKSAKKVYTHGSYYDAQPTPPPPLKVYTRGDYAEVEITELSPEGVAFKVTLKDGRIGRCTMTAAELNACAFDQLIPFPDRLEFETAR